MGKKLIVSVACENERISKKKKNQLILNNVCVPSLLCGPRADLWPFGGLFCKLYYKESKPVPITPIKWP